MSDGGLPGLIGVYGASLVVDRGEYGLAECPARTGSLRDIEEEERKKLADLDLFGNGQSSSPPFR
jgi:hypothetical protein